MGTTRIWLWVEKEEVDEWKDIVEKEEIGEVDEDNSNTDNATTNSDAVTTPTPPASPINVSEKTAPPPNTPSGQQADENEPRTPESDRNTAADMSPSYTNSPANAEDKNLQQRGTSPKSKSTITNNKGIAKSRKWTNSEYKRGSDGA
ncbi:hypothetical protein HK102_004555 [Quaeritorhiza haematococci]|nr:hypothetical protein HK102_004555 [Quaeritorhiza haematococci]